MYFITKRAVTYFCDQESDMDSVLKEFCEHNGGFEITKQEKKLKTKKSKGEIVEQHWEYTITAEIIE